MSQLDLENNTPDENRDAILDCALGHVAFDGWGDKLLTSVAAELGVDVAYIGLAFPKGAQDMVDFWFRRSDQRMLETLEGYDASIMKIREKIIAAIKVRLSENEAHKEAIRRTLAWLALPNHAAFSAKSLWTTADVMWRWAGDRATDYNHYTKRAILSGVYSSTLLIWLDDASAGHAETWAFLDRRIDNVMQFEKVKAKLHKVAEKFDFQHLAERMGAWKRGKEPNQPQDASSDQSGPKD